MVVPLWLWLVTIVGLLVILALDIMIVDHRPHAFTVGEAARWVVFYCACAVVFGVGIWLVFGGRFAGEFFAGYLTEYSLSVDNLFVFMVIMSSFRVPLVHQHRVLLIGVLIALAFRGGLIGVGSAVISAFGSVFYLFGAFLLYTAYRMIRSMNDEPDSFKENAVIRTLRKVAPVSADYHDGRSFVRIEGRRMITPMFVVIVAIGTTDLLFALDSIPAVFGLTQQAYLVFTVNVFALMGLRQLYFLIGGLLRKLHYLPIGLGVLLGYVGIKLILEVLHDDWQPFEHGRQSVPVWVPGTGMSLLVIVAVLALTMVASLVRARLVRRGQPTGRTQG
ncbi:MAG TPA: TerC family protein [Pseudonocardiaceae bacterium]|jgi:tellurite resistance protein TerC|nr:TerC family protein [Pseudonocardiaceae bacterium]